MSEFRKQTVSLTGYEIIQAMRSAQAAIEACDGGAFGYVLTKNASILENANQDLQEQRKSIQEKYVVTGEEGAPKTEVVERPDGSEFERVVLSDREAFREEQDDFLSKETEITVYQTTPENYPAGIDQSHMIALGFMFTDPE